MTNRAGQNEKTGLVADCAADPYDLRPALDVLEREIARRAQYATPDRPLVVLMGEQHNRSAHVALQQGLLGRLLNSASGGVPFAFGFEGPHHWFEKLLTKDLKLKIPSTLRGRVAEYDPDGALFLHTFNSLSKMSAARFANESRFAHCVENGISSRFNDAARKTSFFTGRMRIDWKDPFMRDFVRKNKEAPRRANVELLSADGMELRNHVIVARVMEHCRDANASVYVQHCGRLHLFGEGGGTGGRFEHSLSSLFDKAGADVLPVFIGHAQDVSEDVSVSGCEVLFKRGIHVDGLSDKRFDAYEDNMSEEIVFLESVRAHSGGEYQILRKKPRNDVDILQRAKNILAVHAAEKKGRGFMRGLFPSF